MEEIDLNHVVAEELEVNPDLGSPQEQESDFSVTIGDQPLGIRLRNVFEQLKQPIPPELALYKMFEIWLIPHRFSLVRKRGLAEPTSVGLEIEYVHENRTCSVISVIPGPRMLKHGEVKLNFNATGNVSAAGEFTPGDNAGLQQILKFGSLGFGTAVTGGVGFEYSATVSTPVISAVGIGSSRSEWRFDRHEEPLFGRPIETWAAIALPRRQKQLKYRMKYYYLARTLFFPTRRESSFHEVTCKLLED